MDTIRIDSKNTLMVAHRGVSGLECENTNPAFVAAGNRSYYGIETDVHVTADGALAVFHDDDTKRLAGTKLSLEKSNYEDLRKLELKSDICSDIPRTDYRIPLLQEYADICRRYGKTSVLELKNRIEPEDIKRILDTLEEMGHLDDTIIISFSFDNLVDVRRFKPQQRVQYLVKKINSRLLSKLTEHKMDLDIYYEALTEEWIKKLHDAGIKVNCWTVDDPADGERLASWGVDFITSNILE